MLSVRSNWAGEGSSGFRVNPEKGTLKGPCNEKSSADGNEQQSVAADPLPKHYRQTVHILLCLCLDGEGTHLPSQVHSAVKGIFRTSIQISCKRTAAIAVCCGNHREHK
jgi:hypothetical protein